MISLLCAAALHLAAAYLPIEGHRLGAPVPSLLAGLGLEPRVLQDQVSQESGLADPNAPPMPEVGPSPDPFLPPSLLPDEYRAAEPRSTPAPASASASVAMVGPQGQSIVIWADRIDALSDGLIVRATGHVRVGYGDYALTAGALYFDARDERGRASSHVEVAVHGYQIETDRFTFDLAHQEAQAERWSGVAPLRGRASGDFLFLSPSYALARNAVFSPCMADDPGYYLSSSRLQWHPYRDRQDFEGTQVGLHVSGVTVASMPELDTSVPTRDDRKVSDSRQPLGAQAGYNAYEGAFAAGSSAFALGQYVQGTIPFRITQGRGLLVGTEETAQLGPLSFAGDASYQTPFQGGTYGQRANAGVTMAILNGGSVALGAGYRSDINSQAVDRLGDLSVNFGNWALGPFTLNPTARTGFFRELTLTPQLEWLPTDEQTHFQALATSVHVALAAPAWRPSSWWETDAYAWGTATDYREFDAASSWQWKPSYRLSGVMGLTNQQRWSSRWSTAVGAETDQLVGPSPFYFDPAPSGDRVFGSTSIALTNHWYTDVGLNFYRVPPSLRFAFNNATVRLSYRLPCLSWSITTTTTLFPVNVSVSFSYSIGLD